MPPQNSPGLLWNGKKVPTSKVLPGLLMDEDPDPHGVAKFLEAKAAEREAAGARPGTGISPQVEALATPAETLIDLGLTLAQRQSPEETPYFGAMIPTKRNLAKFIAKMNAAPVAKNMARHPEIGYAQAFLDARYPIRSKRGVRDVSIQKATPSESAGGWFDPDEIETHIFSRGGRPSLLDAQDGFVFSRDNPETAIGTLSHEAQHLLDYMRPASPAVKSEFFGPNRHGTYIEHSVDPVGYRNQRIERRAFRAGDTARQAHDRFLGLLAESNNPRLLTGPHGGALTEAMLGKKQQLRKAQIKAAGISEGGIGFDPATGMADPELVKSGWEGRDPRGPGPLSKAHTAIGLQQGLTRAEITKAERMGLFDGFDKDYLGMATGHPTQKASVNIPDLKALLFK